MKKYIIGITIFFVCFFCADRLVGYISDYLVEHAISGETQKNEYICDRTNEDILIMGSSRAVHHYDPRIIEDSLGLSCYNCGYDGSGSIYFYGLYKIITERYIPKYIIYDVTPFADYNVQENTDNAKFLGGLKYYYDRPGIASLFEMVSPGEKWKMKSNMYRINSKLIQMFKDCLNARPLYTKGFFPQNKNMRESPDWTRDKKNIEIDPIRELCFRKLVKECKYKGTHIIFCVSPWYKRITDESFEFAKNIAEENGIPFISLYNDSTLNRESSYFYDACHLNSLGANVYSSRIAHLIKKSLLQNGHIDE